MFVLGHPIQADNNNKKFVLSNKTKITPLESFNVSDIYMQYNF